jgi:hypothetical protein
LRQTFFGFDFFGGGTRIALRIASSNLIERSSFTGLAAGMRET